MAWLTIDAGTSVIKAVVFADSGRELSVARASATVLREQTGWSEQNMHEVWAAVVSTVHEALSAVPEPIHGIASTAQGDGCWLVDAAGAPTGNAILWNDARAAHLLEPRREAGLVEACYRRSGSVAYPGLPHAILEWLRQQEPERVEAARSLLTANGWLLLRMTGCRAAHATDAANPFGDILRGGTARKPWQISVLEHRHIYCRRSLTGGPPALGFQRPPQRSCTCRRACPW